MKKSLRETFNICFGSSVGLSVAWTFTSAYTVYKDKNDKYPLKIDKVKHIFLNGTVTGLLAGFILPPVIVISAVSNGIILIEKAIDHHD